MIQDVLDVFKAISGKPRCAWCSHQKKWIGYRIHTRLMVKTSVLAYRLGYYRLGGAISSLIHKDLSYYVGIWRLGLLWHDRTHR